MATHLAVIDGEAISDHRQQFTDVVTNLSKARKHEEESEVIQVAISSLEDYLSVFLVLNEDITNLQGMVDEIVEKKKQLEHHVSNFNILKLMKNNDNQLKKTLVH